MTMLSFRVDDADAAAAQEWAQRLRIDRSELLREALRRHLASLRAQADVAAYDDRPVEDEELALGEVAEWGPAEGWEDWADAAG